MQHAVALEHLPAVGVVDGGHVDALVADVVPHVELGPVGQREDPDVLTLVVARVVEVPQLGALALRVPLAELVSEAEDPLLGPSLLLVPPGPAEDGVMAALGDGAQQRRRLQPVAGGSRCVSSTVRPASMSSCTLATTTRTPDVGGVPVPELEHLCEVAPGVDVQHGERDRRRPEGLLGHVQHDDGVLAAREHERGTLELGRHLAEDVDRLRLEGAQIRQAVMARPGGGAEPFGPP